MVTKIDQNLVMSREKLSYKVHASVQEVNEDNASEDDYEHSAFESIVNSQRHLILN